MKRMGGDRGLRAVLGSGLGAIAELLTLPIGVIAGDGAIAAAPWEAREVGCDILIVGGGLAGTAAAQEGLRAGRTVCLTELTDWVGGQLSSQGTAALDETSVQRQQDWFPAGYRAFRDRLRQRYGRLNPGNCWVSVACFLPVDGHRELMALLAIAARQGGGQLHWFPHTVPKGLTRSPEGREVVAVQGIRSRPTPGTGPIHGDRLSTVYEDLYSPQDSPRLQKAIITFRPKGDRWMVIEATETGELLALADLPYRLGVDPRSPLDPSASSVTGDRACPQALTYTFAMEATATPQVHPEPPFYAGLAPLYTYDKPYFGYGNVFTYRRIWATRPDEPLPPIRDQNHPVHPGDISLQNWHGGNNYAPGTPDTVWIDDRDRLEATGQLEAGGWRGGLRVSALAQAEEVALGYFHWIVAGTGDRLLGDASKTPNPNNRLLTGPDSPMGTGHGLSKFPYIREGRRLIGRPSWGYPQGFAIGEVDLSRLQFEEEDYGPLLGDHDFRQLRLNLAGTALLPALIDGTAPSAIPKRRRAFTYPDTVGIGHYPIDFHPCRDGDPAVDHQAPERAGERRAHGQSYPFQIPLRAMIPPDLDNLLVTGKAIATSHIAAAAYRVHPFEWSAGAAAGVVADRAIALGETPASWVDDLPRPEPRLIALQRHLETLGNPIRFPNTSIFNEQGGDRVNPTPP